MSKGPLQKAEAGMDVMIHAVGGTIVEEAQLYSQDESEEPIYTLVPSERVVDQIVEFLENHYRDCVNFQVQYPLGPEMIDSANMTAATLERVVNFIRVEIEKAYRTRSSGQPPTRHVILRGTDTSGDFNMALTRCLSDEALAHTSLVAVDSMKPFAQKHGYVMNLVRAAVDLALRDEMTGRGAHVSHGSAYTFRRTEKGRRGVYDHAVSGFPKIAEYQSNVEGEHDQKGTWMFRRKKRSSAEFFDGKFNQSYRLADGIITVNLTSISDYDLLLASIKNTKAAGYIFVAPGQGNLRSTPEAIDVLKKIARLGKPVVVVGRALYDADFAARENPLLFGQEYKPRPFTPAQPIEFEPGERNTDAKRVLEGLQNMEHPPQRRKKKPEPDWERLIYEGDPDNPDFKNLIPGREMGPTEALILFSEFRAAWLKRKSKNRLNYKTFIQQQFGQYDFRNVRE